MNASVSKLIIPRIRRLDETGYQVSSLILCLYAQCIARRKIQKTKTKQKKIRKNRKKRNFKKNHSIEELKTECCKKHFENNQLN